MPGAMRKLGLYLGLMEDDEERYGLVDEQDEEPPPRARREPRRPEALGQAEHRRPVATPTLSERPASIGRSLDSRVRGSVALDPQPRSAPVAVQDDPYRITTLHPRTYNEARTIGEHFRDGTPVIMNLTEMDDGDAKRLVDFAAGLSFGLRGRIERVTNKVFLLSPEHVEVTAEDKARIESGFFNQS